MTIKGQITTEMPEVSGVSKSGKAYSRKSYVLTYDTFKPEYPKAVVIDVMGDKINELGLKQGHWYEVEVDFSAREFNGKWYMSASAWKATEVQTVAPVANVGAEVLTGKAAEFAAAMGLYPELEKTPADPSLSGDLPF